MRVFREPCSKASAKTQDDLRNSSSSPRGPHFPLKGLSKWEGGRHHGGAWYMVEGRQRDDAKIEVMR